MTKKIENENISNIEKNLSDLYKERFKLLIEKTNGTQFKKRHLLKKNKKNIAKTLTLINNIKREKKWLLKI